MTSAHIFPENVTESDKNHFLNTSYSVSTHGVYTHFKFPFQIFIQHFRKLNTTWVESDSEKCNPSKADLYHIHTYAHICMHGKKVKNEFVNFRRVMEFKKKGLFQFQLASDREKPQKEAKMKEIMIE